MSCFLPSSVMLKSAGFRPLMGFPLLSFTVTSTTTNWVVAPNLTTPFGGAGGVCAARCVCGDCAETTSKLLKSVAIMARIVSNLPLKSNRAGHRPSLLLEPESQRGRHAPHVARIGKQPQGVAPDGRVE